MKRIAAFIGPVWTMLLLKVVEISAAVFVPYWVGLWNPIGFEGVATVPVWVLGAATLFFAFCAFVLCYALVSANWEWAKKLAK